MCGVGLFFYEVDGVDEDDEVFVLDLLGGVVVLEGEGLRLEGD